MDPPSVLKADLRDLAVGGSRMKVEEGRRYEQEIQASPTRNPPAPTGLYTTLEIGGTFDKVAGLHCGEVTG